MSLDWTRDEVHALDERGLLRHPHTIEGAPGPQVDVDGRRLILLCSNNYLGLAGDARVRAAAADAARRYGSGSGASRLVSGTQTIHRSFEVALAKHEATEDCVLFSSGYLANLGVVTALAGPGDVVFSDELNHASIVDACRLSRADVVVYPHRDVASLERLMTEVSARRRFVVTDTVFSMDGDLAPVDDLIAVCARLDATLICDEAHATGVVDTGAVGRAPVIVGTLSKALGSAGGYVATTRDCAALLRNRARTHIFNTAPPPPAVAAAQRALEIACAEKWRGERVRALARGVASELKRLGFDAREPAAAIVPVLVGDNREAVELSERLFDAGVLCPAIRPPSVAEGTARLRVTVMATHTDEHIERALEAFAGRNPLVRQGRRADPRIVRRKGVFVTGTDTGVGKTVVTACVARAFQAAGLRVAIFKPFQTGMIDGADDARYASELARCYGEVGVALAEPLAPSVAARLEDVRIDLDAVLRRFTALRESFDVVVVEGAGGLLVPIVDGFTMADLASALDIPVLVVARPGLGTINHTALTIEGAAGHGLDVIGVVISNYPAHPSTTEATNPRELARIAPIVGVIPSLAGIDVDRRVAPSEIDPSAWLAPELGGALDVAAHFEDVVSA